MFGRSRQLLLATSLLTLALASPASAYLRDFELRSSFGVPNRIAGTFCQAGVPGTTPLGGGGHITPESSGLAINRMWFDFQTRPFITGALRVDPAPDGSFPTWRLDGQAFCTVFTPTGPGPAGGPYLRDVEVVSANTTLSSASEKIRGVSCFDKKIIAGGWAVGHEPRVVAVDSVRSVGNGGVLSVHAYEVDPTPNAWTVTAYAICARVTPVANTPSGYAGNDIRVITHESRYPQIDAYAKCPPGMQIIGGGAQTLGSREAMLAESWPYDGGPSASYEDGWKAQGRQEDPTSAVWSVRARAICANIT